MLAPSTSPETARAIGELCIGGDWACARGDFSTLRHIARCLAAHAPEPLHCELIALANTCSDDPERAAALWSRLRLEDRLFRSAGS